MAAFNSFNIFRKNLCEKVHNLNSDTLKVMLTNTAPVATNSVKADLTEISTGNGYSGPITITKGGYQGYYNPPDYGLEGQKITITATGNVAEFRYVVLYNDTPTSPADPLIGWWDYGSAVNLTNTDTFDIKFDNQDDYGVILLVD